VVIDMFFPGGLLGCGDIEAEIGRLSWYARMYRKDMAAFSKYKPYWQYQSLCCIDIDTHYYLETAKSIKHFIGFYGRLYATIDEK